AGVQLTARPAGAVVAPPRAVVVVVLVVVVVGAAPAAGAVVEIVVAVVAGAARRGRRLVVEDFVVLALPREQVRGLRGPLRAAPRAGAGRRGSVAADGEDGAAGRTLHLARRDVVRHAQPALTLRAVHHRHADNLPGRDPNESGK